MAAPLFCMRLGHDVGLDLGFDVEFLEAPVLFFEFFHAGHHGGVHATVLGPPFVKGGRADAHVSAQLWNGEPALHTFERLHALAIGKSRFFHVELLSKKILLLTTLG